MESARRSWGLPKIKENLVRAEKRFSENLNFLRRYSFYYKKIFDTLAIFRLISFILMSVMYMFGWPYVPVSQKLLYIFYLLLASLLLLLLYIIYESKLKVVGTLILLETLGVVVLMYYTGNLESPFFWCILNPVISASAYLPAVFAWLVWLLFISTSLWGDIYRYHFSGTIASYFVRRAETILSLFVIAFFIHIFARLYLILMQQSQVLKEQQEELLSTYTNLSDTHLVIKSLSEYQRDTVSSKNEQEIFNRLCHISKSIFPFSETAVLLLDEPVPAYILTPKHSYTIICNSEQADAFTKKLTMDEIKDRWQQFSAIKMLLGSRKDWVAFPIHKDKERILAVFVGWIGPGTSMVEFPGNIPLFIQFTEQVIQNIYNLKQTKLTLQHLSSLYESLETITSREDLTEIVDLFSSYAKALTRCDKIIFWIDNYNFNGIEQNSIYTVRGSQKVLPEELWYGSLIKIWQTMKNDPRPIEKMLNLSGSGMGHLICVPVYSGSRCFGILAAVHDKKLYNTEEVIKTLSFLAKLSSVSIERNAAELFTNKLLVIEEQNRIANEIHDNISQNLFSIVYGINALIKRFPTLSPDLQEHLSTIKDVASSTAKELRLLIYRLSPRYRGDNTFVKELQKYLHGLESLNNVSIDFQVSGKEEFLNPSIRRAFYRIIKEATGNAVRHGKSTEITVDLEMAPFHSNLKIVDNGRGFEIDNYKSPDKYSKKLGLLNMGKLAQSLKGNLHIESQIGKGTTVNCSVPTAPVSGGGIAKNL